MISTVPGDRREIWLVDADAFFASVARRIDPKAAAARLLIVGGRPGSRGVVSSACYESRRRGVHAGMSIARASQLCPEAYFAPVPGEACRHYSREIARLLERVSPVVEAGSIDEFYVDLTPVHSAGDMGQMRERAAAARAEIESSLGLSTSIGVATSRLVAKIAAGLAKPGSVHVVPPGAEASFLSRFDLAELPGVGPRLSAELAGRGLVRIADAQQIGLVVLAAWLGERRARWLHDRVFGIDPTPVSSGFERARSISRDQTFDADVRHTADLLQRLPALVGEAAIALRSDGSEARTIHVRLRDWEFNDRAISRTLRDPIRSHRAILAVCRELVSDLHGRHGAPVRLLGVGLSNLLVRGDARQLPLFDNGLETETSRSLAEALSDLESRWGRGVVRIGG